MKKVNTYIERKTLLYKTGVEYGDYTINHVQGCSHGCKYPCYAFLMAKRFGKVKTYEEWIEPKVVGNAIELLQQEIPKLKSRITSVHLCFSTDPFMYQYNEISELSIRIIKELNKNGIKCTALTKGLLPIELAGLRDDNEFGITLISLNEDFRRKIEPFASSYNDRIESLYKLHQKGCKTWVSIEPYPTPNIIEQDFQKLLDAVLFTDRIIFGRTNYNSSVSQFPGCKEYYNQLSLLAILRFFRTKDNPESTILSLDISYFTSGTPFIFISEMIGIFVSPLKIFNIFFILYIEKPSTVSLFTL